MPTPRILSSADYRRMPWKNGGGETTEIATFPAGSDLETFAWRISMADVREDGPFSRFPGVERTLVLLAGEGMRLTGGAAPLEVRTPFTPLKFAGDDALQCHLFAGPVRDFNVMTRRTSARAEVVVCRDGRVTAPAADAYVCHAAEGAAMCAVDGAPPVSLAPGQTLVVAADEGRAALPLRVDAGESAVALVVAIRNA